MSPRSSYPAGPPPRDTSTLLVHLDFSGGRLDVIGRLDGATAHLLYDAVSAALLAGTAIWTVDVTRLNVGDDSGLRALGAAYLRALRHDRRVTIRGASPALPSLRNSTAQDPRSAATGVRSGRT